MKKVNAFTDLTNDPLVEYENDSRKEKDAFDDPTFPYNLTITHLDRSRQRFAPWHWHPAVEIFYIQQGSLEYETPHHHMVFPQGSAGMINANILHTSHSIWDGVTIQKLHIFDPSFIASHGSRIEHDYVLPITLNTQFELIRLDPNDPMAKTTIHQLINSFDLDSSKNGYEIFLRNQLSEIWFAFFQLVHQQITQSNQIPNDQRLKAMLIAIHEQFDQPLDVSTIACAGSVSVRECYRLFSQWLHISPNEYLRRYRIEKACTMLSSSDKSLTQIAYDCGFTNSSNFTRAFKAIMECSPRQYRSKWQNMEKN